MTERGLLFIVQLDMGHACTPADFPQSEAGASETVPLAAAPAEPAAQGAATTVR